VRTLSWAGGWQAVTIAVALVVGGTAMMAPQAGELLRAFRWLGYAFLILGLVIFIVAILLLQQATERRHVALAALGRLVGRGDVTWRAWNENQDATGEERERWRTAVGNRLRRPPFVPGAADWVLTQQGNRLDDPLARLRAMQSDVERWIE
jgi:hypothetical protein